MAGLYTFEHSARATSWGRPFSRLGPEQARAHFARWWSLPVGPLHQLAKALKMFLAMAYYNHPQVKERLGYDPDRWIAEVTQRRQEQFGEEIAKLEAQVFAPDPLIPPEEP